MPEEHSSKEQKRKRRLYRVWVSQVNQAYVEVYAADKDEAAEKGYRKWRRDVAHSDVSYIEEAT